MHLALTIWNGSIATVADFAQRLQLVQVDHGRIVAQREAEAPGHDAACWCARLAGEGVGTLICGAITRHLGQRLELAGITVVDGCAGPTAAVLAAWLAGTVDEQRLRLPGCHRWRGGRGSRSGRASTAPTNTLTHPKPFPMRIAITTTAVGLDAGLDPRFGRTLHVLVCATDSEAVTPHDNPTATTAEHGAGIRTAEFVARLGVQAVITGAVGPKAMQVLRAAGIAAYACDTMPARQALELFRAGKLVAIP